MQNWRHAGRFNTHMIPLDTSGIGVTDGSLNLGTTTNPWGDLNLATGASIYIGGSAFQGGGGGSGIEAFEQKSHLEKIGYDYPLSNAQSQNESFMDSAAMVLTLGKTHLLTETTIYLDRDAISISAIDAASATAWTPINTGTTATNTTAGQSVDGTSVKHRVASASNTSYYMAHSFTSFSLTDKDAKVWLYPDTVSNLTAALIRFECATTTVYCEFQKLVASLTAATLNSLCLNMDAPDTTTASFNRSAITRVYLGAKGTATPQTFEWSWDKLRSVDNRPIKVPVQMICDNGTNQEFINITTATVAGDVYTLDTTTTYTHTISSTEIKLKQLDIAGAQGVIASGTTGEASKIGWDIQRTYMNTTTSGDLILTSRWYDESYEIATITNASTTVLEVTTSTVAAGFKSGDVVRLYTWEYIDQDYQSPLNASIGSNFLDLTLTADGTATSSQLTIVHGNTSNQNLGGDSPSKWRGVRVSADDYYRVEAATASQALVKATPTIWIPSKNSLLLFTDLFNRIDGAVANNWTSTTLAGSTGGASLAISSNKLYTYADSTKTQTSKISRVAEPYYNTPIEVYIEYTPSGGTSFKGWSFTIATCSNGITSCPTPQALFVGRAISLNLNYIDLTGTFLYFSGGNTAKTTKVAPITMTIGNTFAIKIQFYDNKIKSKIGLKNTGDGWQMCLQPLGSTMVIIKSIENDALNLYDLTQETGIINLANCPTFSLHRK